MHYYTITTDFYFIIKLTTALQYINSILAIIYLNEQVLNKQVLKPD